MKLKKTAKLSLPCLNLTKKTKFILFCISIFIFIQNNIFASKIKHEFYHDNNYQLKQNGNYWEIITNGAINTAKIGEPSLPYFPIKLMLPKGEIADKINIYLSEETEIGNNIQLFPKQYVKSYSSNENTDFSKNLFIYNSSDSYPLENVSDFTNQFLNGYGIVLSNYTPFKYIPNTGKLTMYKKVIIEVVTKSDTKTVNSNELLINKKAITNKVSKLVQNPEIISNYNVANKSVVVGYDNLILTNSTYKDKFENYINNYQNRGIISKVISVDSIYANTTGIDNQDKIRNFIKSEYQNHGIQYVVLAGDVEIIPFRGFYCHVQSSSVYEDDNIPSDLYYASLDGTWNTDNDSKWAEIGEDDLLPELSIGRLPFSNNTELTSILNKILSYSNTPVNGELNKPLMVGEKLWDSPATWGADYMELLIGYKTDNGYTSNGIPNTHNIQKLYDKTFPGNEWAVSDLLSKINAGSSFIHHSGHSNFDFNMRMYNADITNANFNQVNGTTHNFPLVYTHGCICGAFDESDCIAEHMVKINNFAVAFIGNSRYGWFNEGQTEGPSEHLHREFVNALYTDSLNILGETHKASKIKSASWINAPGQWEEGALRWCYYENNIIGDPLLHIWTDNITDINVNYPQSIANNTFNLNIEVNIGLKKLENLNCVILQNNKVIGNETTDSLGNANIVFNQPPQTGNITLIVSGYNVLSRTFTILVTDGNGFNEITNKKDIKLYPNPTNSILTIESKNNINANIDIYNIYGVKVLQQIINDKIESIDVSDLAKGYYFIKIKNTLNEETLSFIKQ